MRYRFHSWITAAFAIAALAVFGSACHAGPMAGIEFSSTSNNSHGIFDSSWSLGWKFTVKASITITALGFYDDFGNGLTEHHDVGLYTTFGHLIEQVTVTNADPLIGHFRYHDLATPVYAFLGYDFVIAGVTGSESYTWNTSGFTVNPDIHYVQSRYTLSDDLAFPASIDSHVANGLFGPDFLFSRTAPVVPEPASLVLLGIGVVGALGYGCRSRILRTTST